MQNYAVMKKIMMWIYIYEKNPTYIVKKKGKLTVNTCDSTFCCSIHIFIFVYLKYEKNEILP